MAAVGTLDPRYFDTKLWELRVRDWGNQVVRRDFWEANAKDLSKRLASGACVVINIGAHALLCLLRGDRYKNAYILASEDNSPSYILVGAQPAKPVEEERIQIDRDFELDPPQDYFFAAASLEGVGVRYYGEYCMVLSVPGLAETQIVDRDSYELLFEPLRNEPRSDLVAALRGSWSRDFAHMATLKTRHVLERQERITTSPVLARALLEGEEFIEIHLELPPVGGQVGFGREAVAEVRQDSRDIAAAERIDAVFEAGQRPRMEELVFAYRRKAVERELAANAIDTRVVREGRTS